MTTVEENTPANLREERAGRLLSERKLTIAAAESCTGGLLTSRLTDVAGSSAYVKGAVVSYTNEVKADLLGVAKDTLSSLGAVSAPVARQMAEGVRALIGTDLGVGVTGLAGPGGGTAEKPVGLVFIGCYMNDRVTVEEHRFQGDRTAVRTQAVQSALRLLRATILENTKG